MSAFRLRIEAGWLSSRFVSPLAHGVFIRAAAALAILASSSLLSPAMADPTFRVLGSGPCASFPAQDSSFAITRSASDGCLNGNSNSVDARASSGGLGIRVDLTAYYVNGYVNASATARADTTIRITGPQNISVPVSLNLWLTSSHTGDNGGRLGIDASLFGFGEVIQYMDGTLGQRNGGLFIPDIDCLVCIITTQTINLMTNVDYGFGLGLTGLVEGLIPDNALLYAGGIMAMNSLIFPTTGPVFNLPEGYSAFIDGMNVVDNRVVSVNGVPEPGVVPLALIGIVAAMFAMRLRARANATPRMARTRRPTALNARRPSARKPGAG